MTPEERAAVTAELDQLRAEAIDLQRDYKRLVNRTIAFMTLMGSVAFAQLAYILVVLLSGDLV